MKIHFDSRLKTAAISNDENGQFYAKLLVHGVKICFLERESSLLVDIL